MKVKIAIVLEATLGGTRKHIIDLLTLLPKDTFDITFIYSTFRADPAFLECIKGLSEKGVTLLEFPMKNSFLSLSNFSSLYKLYKTFKRRKFDVIHLHASIAGFLGRVACFGNRHVKTIFYSPHGGSFHLMSGIKGIFFNTIEQLLLTKKVWIIAVSEFEKQTILKKLKVSSDRIVVIHNGIDVKQNSIEIDKAQFFKKNGLDFPDNAFVVLYPAVFLPAKGHMNFFKKFIYEPLDLNDNVFILLAGEGPLSSQIRSAVNQSSISKNVRFLGFRTDLDHWISHSDLVILPSKNEVFGYVVLEAFRAKKAVFASRVGGITEIIENGKDGIMFDYDKIEQMVPIINHYSNNQYKLSSLGQNGYEKITKKFSVGIMIERLSIKYKTIHLTSNKK